MSRPIRRNRRRRGRGFTFTELLVAGFISVVVLLTVYLVFVSNTEQYYRQEQIVQMQEGMRFALEYLKNDLRNAGKLAVSNGTLDDTVNDPGFCGKQAGLIGVELFDNEAGQRPRVDPPEQVPAVLTANNNGLQPDRLRILLDATGGIPLETARIAGTTVEIEPEALQATEQAREMLLPAAAARFDATYQPGYYLFIKQSNGEARDLVPIDEVDFGGGDPEITLTRGFRCGVDCSAGQCIVAAVQLVEYAVVGDAADAQKTNLARRVIDARDGTTVLAGRNLIMAEYVVNMQVWGTYDHRPPNGPVAQIAPDDDPKDDIGNWPNTNVESARMNASPHRLRALNVMLATRTPREDESFAVAIDRGQPPAARVPTDRTWFELDNAPGFARVATLLTEVQTPNMFKGKL